MSLIKEIQRKSFHMLLVIVPIIFYNYGKNIGLAIFMPITAVLVWLDYSRRNNDSIQNLFVKFFGKIMRDHEMQDRKLCGASFVGLAICFNFLLMPMPIAITGFLILVFSDSLAALVGKSVVSQPFFEKSFAGSIAFFVSGLIIMIAVGIHYELKFLFYFFGFFCTLFVCVLEARPSIFNIDDNFLIPTAFSVSMIIFNLLWSFL